MTSAEQAWMLFESVKAKHSGAISEFSRDDGLIEQDDVGVTPITINDQTVELTIPPTASDAIQNAADHILTDPRISVPPRPGTDRDEAGRTASRLQQFYMTFWNNVFQYCGDPLGYGKTQLLKGKMVLKFEVDWENIPELPDDPTRADRDRFRRQMGKAARSSNLMGVKLLPKETVYEDPSDPRKPMYVFEEYRITHREAAEKFGRLSDIAAIDPLGEAEYVECWERPSGSSKGKFIQWVDRKVVHEAGNPFCWEHPLSTDDKPRYEGFVPYVIGDPGWGDLKADPKPEDRYVSLIRRSRSVFRGEIEMMTSMREYLKEYVFPPVIGKNIPKDKEIGLYPGAVFDLQEGQEISFMQLPQLPIGLLQGLQRILQYVDQSAKIGTLGGTPLRGVDTATEADQTIRNAAAKLSGPIRTIRWMVMRINEMAGQTVEHVFETPITLYGTSGGYSEVTVSPRDFNGFYLTEVELDTADEAALNLNNARTWSDLAQRLPISFKTVMRQAGIQNGEQEMDERMLEDLERSNPSLTWLIGTMMQMLGGQPQVPGGGDNLPPEQPAMESQQSIDQQQREAAQQQAPARALR